MQQSVPPVKLDGTTGQQQADDPTVSADGAGRAPTKLLRKAINDVRLEAESGKSGQRGSTGGGRHQQSPRVPRLPTPPGDEATKPHVRSLTPTQHCEM